MFNRFASSAGTTSAPSSVNNSFFNSSAPTNPAPSPFSSTPASNIGLPSTPYSVTADLENGVSIKLLSMSAMPAYRHLSHEEIRVDDYSRNRKGPSTFPGSTPGAFSQPFSTPQANPFGAQPSTAQPTSLNPFGGPSQSLFGSNTNSSLFGAPQQQQQQQQPSTSGFGFGGSSTGSGGIFGSTPSSGFGATTGSGFGAASSNAFGSNAPVQNAFGSSTPVSSGFGSSAPASTGFGSSTMFGASKPAVGTGLFGSTTPSTSTSGAFGSFPSNNTGMFGQSQQPQPSSTGFGAGFGSQPSTTQQPQGFGGNFGSNVQTSNNLFGSNNSSANSAGLFGSAPSTGGGMFGSATPAPAQSTGLFGQPQQNPATPASGFSGFGTSASAGTSAFGGSSLFGQSQLQQPQQQQQQQPQTSQFQHQPQQQSQPFSFNRPTTNNFGSLMNSAPSSTTPLPTSTSASQQPLASGTSSGAFNLFNRPQATGTSTTGGGGLFSGFGGSTSSSTQPSSATGSSLFGSSSLASSSFPQTSSSFPQTSMFSSQQQFNTGASQQQQQMNLPLVSSSLSLAPALPSIYTAKPSEASSEAKSSVPAASHKFTPRTSFRIKPRDSYTLNAPIPLNYGVTGSAAVSSGGLVPRKIISTNTGSLKKLIIGDFEEHAHYNYNNQHQHDNISVIQSQTQTTKQTTAQTSSFQVQEEESILTSSMSFGQVYMFPPAASLKSLAPAEKSSVKNFIVGQKGIGQIRFLCPVDLNGIDIDSIVGRLVQFYEGEAVLYGHPSDVKPAPGQGLNVPAQVRLDRIWTFSRGSHEPIVDPKSEKVILFIEKLKETEGTHFINYDPTTGTWTFTVDHF